MRVGSLFSGIGGIDLAAERAGMTVAWQSEIDPSACRVLAHHWPNVRNYGDITRAHGLPAVDVVVGGFPCQDLSVAGRRAGLAGARSGLWWEFHRVLTELRPTWVVIENVPGLLSSGGGRDMGTILGALGNLGYWWAYRVLDAQHFGLAQRRRRVFIVGHLGDRAAPATVLLEPESMLGDSPPRRTSRQDVAGSLSFSTSPSGGGGHRNDLDGTTYVTVPALTASGRGVERAGESRGQDPVIPFDLTQVTSWANRQRLDADSPARTLHAAGGAHVIQMHAESVASTLSASYYKGPGFNGQDDNLVAHAMTAEGADASEDGTGRGSPLVAIRTAQTSANGHGIADDVAHTLDGANGQAVAFNWQTGGDMRLGISAERGDALGTSQTPAVQQAMQVRRLTPLECERLQGFPDGWTDIPELAPDAMSAVLLRDGRIVTPKQMSDSARYRMLGNAVAVPVVEWILRRIAEYGGTVRAIKPS